MSYAKFIYSQLNLSHKLIEAKKDIQVTVQVTNDSNTEGKEVVELYLSDLYRSFSTPPVKKLIDFKKINFAPHETKQVSFTVSLDQLGFIGTDYKRIVERGEFKLQIDSLSESFSF